MSVRSMWVQESGQNKCKLIYNIKYSVSGLLNQRHMLSMHQTYLCPQEASKGENRLCVCGGVFDTKKKY